jgi:hypothetical protein
METCLSLYSTFAPVNPGILLLTCQARRYQEGDISISIFDHCMLETGNKHKNYIHFDF